VLWRAAYEPQVLGPFPVPTFDGVLVGGFDVLSLSEMEIWMRLLESSGIDWRFGLVGDWDVSDLVRPSRLSRCMRLEEFWRSAVSPDRVERSFCAFVRDGVAVRTVVGPPTEEVWEEFERLMVGA